MKDINHTVEMLKSLLNLNLQQNMKVALNTKRALTKKIGSVKNVEDMKVVQIITLDVTSIPGGTINGAQHLNVKSRVLNVTMDGH